MALIEMQIYSEVLSQEMEVWAVFPHPDSFRDADRKRIVLWLLPSGNEGCTDWIRHSDIENMAKKRGIAVIMPGLHRSCGVDMAMGAAFGTFAGRELIGIMRGMFPFLSGQREDNYVAGFSNGGYASFYLAMKFPETFGAACGLAAGDKADAAWEERPWYLKGPVFGEGDLHRTEYSYIYAAQKLVEQHSAYIPRIFHAYGTEDPWVHLNEQAAEFFRSYKEKGDPFAYECFPIPGHTHNFRMCEIGLEAFFNAMQLPAPLT